MCGFFKQPKKDMKKLLLERKALLKLALNMPMAFSVASQKFILLKNLYFLLVIWDETELMSFRLLRKGFQTEVQLYEFIFIIRRNNFFYTFEIIHTTDS